MYFLNTNGNCTNTKYSSPTLLESELKHAFVVVLLFDFKEKKMMIDSPQLVNFVLAQRMHLDPVLQMCSDPKYKIIMLTLTLQLGRFDVCRLR